jgi:Tfp pilus assembly protein PilV
MLKPHDERGFTLVEAMVALGIMLAGIAGCSLLLLRGVQHERESATRRAAIGLAGSLAEELRVLRLPDQAPLTADAPVIVEWRAKVLAELPDGADASVDPVGTRPPGVRITIAWPVAGLGMQRLTLAVAT